VTVGNQGAMIFDIDVARKKLDPMSEYHKDGWMDAHSWYQLTTLLNISYYMAYTHVSRMKHVKGMEYNVPKEDN
jgi:hypothetical protein